MKFGNYIFKDYKEYQAIFKSAVESGVKNLDEFANFLSANYSHKKIGA